MRNVNKYLAIGLIGLITTSCTFSGNSMGGEIEGDGNVISKERAVGNFNRIENHSIIDVKLVAPGEALTIKADSNLLPHIKTEVSNETLKLDTKKSFEDVTSLKIKVPVNNLESITNEGTGYVKSDKTINAKKFKINAKGTGEIELSLNCDQLSFKSLGTGDCQLTGATDKADIKITGTGDLKGSEFKANEVQAKLTGTADCVMHVKDTLRVRSLGTGDFRFKGDPEIKNISTTGTGDVEPVN